MTAAVTLHCPTSRRHLPPVLAFYLQASIVVTLLAASSAPTPLYSVYQREWAFSPITTTVVFGIYALAVLVALLTVGSLSDHVGRRPVLLSAIAIQVVALGVFAAADGVPTLLLARVLQGLSTGAAVGALGAGMLDLNRSRGTIANGVAPMTGTALGALISGLMVQYLPAPTHLVYEFFLAVFVLQAVGVYLMTETSSRRSGALAALSPQIALPPVVRRSVLIAAPALIAIWSLAGFYGALGPSLVRIVVGSNSFVFGGLALFVLAASAAITVMVLRTTPPRTVMTIGLIALLVGVEVTLIAVAHSSPVGFFVGTAVAGVGFGGGFQGALRIVIPLAASHQLAGVLSVLYLISYLAMGLPAVVGGFLVVHHGGVLVTAHEYGLAVMTLGALALLGLMVMGARKAPYLPAVTPVDKTEALVDAC
jgi:predicted MFS family arabinose efflux permease